MAISGVKSVDFLIQATGEGVVNHNGSFSVYNPAAKSTVQNHLFPKLRGMDPMQRLKNDTSDRTLAMRLDDPQLAAAKLMVSAECIRAALFKDVSYGLVKVVPDNVAAVLASLHGLVRGYLITEGGRNFSRKSPLYATDFECAKPGLVFNQGTNSKVRGTADEKTSIYSYFKTDGNLSYIGKMTLSIEDLQYIPLENSLGRSAYDFQVSVDTGKAIAEAVTAYLADLAQGDLAPQVRFVKRAVRVGAVAQRGDAGLLLNDDAVRVIIHEIRALIEGLYIRQGKGFLQVTDVLVDFNDSSRVFRAEADSSLAVDNLSAPFAHYYEEVNISDKDFADAQTEAKAQKAALAKAKSKGKGTAKKDSTPEVAADTETV